MKRLWLLLLALPGLALGQVTGPAWTGGNGATGQVLTSNGPTSLPSFQVGGGGGSGTVNPATQYYFPYYSAVGSASTLSGVGCSSPGFIQGSSSGVPACVAPQTFPNLTAYTTPATGDLLLIGSAANSYATDQITLTSLFSSTPAIGINPGPLSAAAWSTRGLVFNGTAATLTDTTTTGSATPTETALGLPAFTIGTTNTGVTIANLDELYVPNPVAGTNVTATSLWAIHTPGNLYVQGGANIGNSLGISSGNVQIGSSGTNVDVIGALIFSSLGTGISHASWTTNGLAFRGSPSTLTDTTSSGTVAIEAAAALPAYTLNSTTATTFTDWDTLYIAAPLCTGNATCSTLWSLQTAGSILDAGQLYDTALTTGTNADFLCLTAAGQVVLQASACTISSLRFKTNVSDLLDASPVLKLDIKSFQMKQTAIPNHDPNFTHPQVGLIAENVAAVVPECAVYENDMKTPKSYRPECIMALGVRVLQDHQRVLTRDEVWLALLTLWCALLSAPYAIRFLKAR